MRRITIVVETFQALGVLVLAFLPGALYMWAFEREAGGWGLGVTDRLLRFVGFSAVFHALAAPLTYIAYRDFIVSGRLAHGKALPLWLWLVPVVYVAIPTLAGTFTGVATAAGRNWTRFVAGRSPAPRAWDHLFSAHDLDGWVRVKLKEGGWLAGTFAKSPNGRLRSYAAGYPDAQDLYLAETHECDPQTGEFLVDDEDRPIPRGTGLLIRWEEAQYLEFIDTRPGRRAATGDTAEENGRNGSGQEGNHQAHPDQEGRDQEG
jgi:Family of unknown function (DUF6338)